MAESELDLLKEWPDNRLVDVILFASLELIVRHKLKLLHQSIEEIQLWCEGGQILKSILSDKETQND